MKEIFRKNSVEDLCVGYDVSGIIKSVGSRVTSVKEGDEVVGKSLSVPSYLTMKQSTGKHEENEI